jgi:hypothetical protein
MVEKVYLFSLWHRPVLVCVICVSWLGLVAHSLFTATEEWV